MARQRTEGAKIQVRTTTSGRGWTSMMDGGVVANEKEYRVEPPTVLHRKGRQTPPSLVGKTRVRNLPASFSLFSIPSADFLMMLVQSAAKLH